MQRGSKANDAEQWARINQYIASQVAAEEAHANTKTIPTRTHVEKWFDDNADRAADMMTFGDHKELGICLVMNDNPVVEYLDRRLCNQAMTLNEFKRLTSSQPINLSRRDHPRKSCGQVESGLSATPQIHGRSSRRPARAKISLTFLESSGDAGAGRNSMVSSASLLG
jgi:hypothetical protein